MKRIDFNVDWVFYKEGDDQQTAVILPHDAMLLEPRSADALSGAACGFFSGGKYHYVKTFTVPDEWRDQTALLYFEGVYQNAVVLLNGERAGGCAYGYSAFTVPLTDWRVGEENRIEVIADNSQTPNSRWYSGAGIFRPVSLLLGCVQHIRFQGIKITTLAVHPARIQVEINHTGGQPAVEIWDSNHCVASAQGSCVELEIPNAKLWNDTNPNLYTCRASLFHNGEKVDESEEKFGVRLITYNSSGLFINGVYTLLRGGCIHHDNGILGAKACKEAEWRKVRILKECGYNAIRSSHNPCSEELLNACDFYGVYVMDESWDMWFGHKNRFDYAGAFLDNWRFDLTSMVAKDLNHPSVILYSIGNEVAEPVTEKGLALEKEMVSLLHQLDPTRPVTGGFNIMIMGMANQGKAIYDKDKVETGKGPSQQTVNSSLLFNIATTITGSSMDSMANFKRFDRCSSAALDSLDIAGYNYAAGRYPKEGRLHPQRVIFGSETFSHAIAKNWRMVERYPYLIGDFMWTAWDYLGEAGAGAWGYTSDAKGFEKPYPWLLADIGALDILGSPNGALFQAQAVWGVGKEPRLAVRPVKYSRKTPAKSAWRGTNAIPSWSWANCDGERAIVEVYTAAAQAELWLNGQRVGRKRVRNCKAMFKPRYAPGILETIAYDSNGNEIGRDQLVSAIGSNSVAIIPEQEQVTPGQVFYLSVQIQGENGVVECNADRFLTITVQGGELLGFGSANPRTEESFVSGAYTTYYGRAQAVIRAGTSASVRITVEDDNSAYEKEISIDMRHNEKCP